MPYMPSDVSEVATNISKLRQVKRSVADVSGGLSGLAKSLSPILNFDKEVKDRIEDISEGGVSLFMINADHIKKKTTVKLPSV